jgi:hypothetical protein
MLYSIGSRHFHAGGRDGAILICALFDGIGSGGAIFPSFEL